MIKKSISEILSEFDFTDSIIVDVRTTRLLTDLILEIDYYWDLQDGRNETRILLLKFSSCKSVCSRVSDLTIKAMENDENVDSYFTIVKTLQEDENTLAIYNGIGTEPFLRVEFENVELLDK